MTAAAIRPGIVDLRDLASRGLRDREELPRLLEAAGLVLESEVVRRFAPPRVVLVVVGYDGAWMLKRTRTWLSESEHVVVFREVELAADPDLREVFEQEWGGATEGLASAEIVDDFKTAMARAMALTLATDGLPRTSAPPSSFTIDELPPSPWTPYDTKFSDFAFLDRIERRGRELVVGPILPLPWKTPEEARAFRHRNPGFMSIGADPVHRPVGWRGDRMSVYWTWKGEFFTDSDHDYPCGPGKKLWGHEDNHPVQVTLAPDASMYAARFGHDVLVTRAVPLPWRAAGAFDVVVREPDPYRAVFYAQDPENDEIPIYRPDDIWDEDGREFAPALVLTPGGYALDLSLRVYRIMNTGPENAAECVHIGGPDEGFAVFDGEHRVVRRASGKLIGGWYRYATIESEGAYWREDLTTGERARIAPVDFALSEDPEIEAVARDAILEGRFERAIELRSAGPVTVLETKEVYALPQTKNVLLVSKEHVRVI